MKKYLPLIIVLVVILLGCGLKIEHDKYYDTHLHANTVVYYIPQHIYLHITQDCPRLYGGRKSMLCKDTYGRMKNSKMSNKLCPDCVPPQYIH